MPEPEYFISQGIGSHWSTYTRKPNGSLRRVKSDSLPQRHTREEAERDLRWWIWQKYTTPVQRRGQTMEEWYKERDSD